MMNIFTYALSSFLLLASLLNSVQAEVAVIVSPDNKNTYTDIDKDWVARIYLAKVMRFPDGSVAKPINLTQGHYLRDAFNRDFLSKTESQLSRYWSRLRFSGKAELPKEISTVKEMKHLIANDTRLIGYIDAMDVDDTVKVVHKY
jgi:hypothetical protein